MAVMFIDSQEGHAAGDRALLEEIGVRERRGLFSILDRNITPEPRPKRPRTFECDLTMDTTFTWEESRF